MRIMQSLKIVTILRKEVVEKNAEFENSDNLRKRSCYEECRVMTWIKVMRILIN